MFGETVTRQRRTAAAVDRYGNPTYTWVDSDLDGAAFDPGGSVEPVEVGRAAVITTPKLFFQTAVDITVKDRMVVRGFTYTVEGRPAEWASAWGSSIGGLVVELKAVEG